MVLYRYETESGYGPYSTWHDELLRMTDEHSEDSDRWPVPDTHLLCDLKESRERDYWRCALVSLDAVDRWFKGWHKTLRECGFNIVVYVIDDSGLRQQPDHVGQVVFDLRSVQYG